MLARRLVYSLGVALGLSLGLSGCDHGGKGFPHAAITPDPAKPMPVVALTQANGKPFRLTDYQGKWVWLYFGYANCPDVCPAALDFMGAEYKQLKQPDAVQGVFVSVDPKRDTPSKLGAFVHYYNPRFVGVTGDRSSLDTLAKAVGAGYVIDPPTQGSAGYSVSHTNMIFVIDPQGRYVATYVPGSGKGDLATDFNALTAH